MRLAIKHCVEDFGESAGMSETVRERCLFGRRYRKGMHRLWILYEAYGANRRYRYPGSAFGSNGEGYVRMALVVNESVIEEIVDVLDASGIFKKNSIKESDI